MSKPSPAPLLAWPMLCLALILVGLAFNLSEPEISWAWPTFGAAPLTAGFHQLLAITAGFAAVILAIISARKLHRKEQAGIYFEWVLLHLLFYAALWIVLPASQGNAWLWALGVTMIVSTAILVLGSRNSMPPANLRYFFSIKDALPDGIFLLLPLVAGIWLSQGVPVQHDSQQWLTSIFLYPLYALVQFSIFLLIPATRLIKMGYSSRSISISCAVVFCLAHWPNPLLMVVTGITMLVWAGQYLRGRNILILALIMGLSATGFRLMMPRQWSWDMRIGPDYIEKRTEHAMSQVPTVIGPE